MFINQKNDTKTSEWKKHHLLSAVFNETEAWVRSQVCSSPDQNTQINQFTELQFWGGETVSDGRAFAKLDKSFFFSFYGI